jgi:carbon-monoxide dehydrogenase medium subunit
VAEAAGLGIVAEAARRIANPPVRNMGTLGGSISHADPGADYPPALLAADAEIEIAGPAGRRRLPAGEFFTDWYATALEPGEMVAFVHLPPPPTGAVAHYEKLARVEGDMGIAMVAVVLEAGGRARIAVGGCGPAPVRLAEAEAAGAGAGEKLAQALDPPSDARASEEYRRRVVPRMVEAALAAARAKREQGR